MNEALQDWINGLAGHSPLADDLMRAVANDVNYLVVPLLVLLWFWPGAGRGLNQRLVLGAALAIGLAKLLADGLGELHYVARPFVTDPATRLLIAHGGGNGFPSGHTSFAFSVAGALVWWRPRLGAVALVCAAAVGFARVYVGVHWPFDVAAGAAVGLFAGAIGAAVVPLLVGRQRWAGGRLPPWLLAPP